MSQPRRFFTRLGSLLVCLAAACNAVASGPGEVMVPGVEASATACPTGTAGGQIAICSSPALTASILASATANSLSGPELLPTLTLAPVESPTASPSEDDLPSPTPCPPDLCAYASQLFLQRPIALPGNQVVDVTYRFGSTQGKRRDPHHGVELLNPFGTPVLAAADGVVVVAGDDKDPTSPRGAWPITFFGLYSYFYGNLVVLQHEVPAGLRQAFPELPQPIFTLYAHLSEISVQAGQTVSAGQQIGKVGMTGVATGNHLHFEVRLGENSYKSSRNPELWLSPLEDGKGRPMGALAVRVLDSFNNYVKLTDIVLRHLPEGVGKPHDLEFYLLTYEEKALIGQPPFFESFASGDLPEGLYRITFPHLGLREYLVQVFPGQLTVMTIRVE